MQQAAGAGSCLRVLPGGDGAGLLLDFLAATAQTGNRAFLIFGESQRLRDGSVVSVTEKLAAGHASALPHHKAILDPA